MRQTVSKSRRFEVFKRDDFTCQYCGRHPPAVVLEVDHINAVSTGGNNEQENLITACFDCNRGKAARPLSMAPKGLAEKAAEVAEREAQIAGYAAVMEAARERLEEDVWRVAEELQEGAREGYSRANFTSIKRFVTELGVHEALEAADIANAKQRRGSSYAFKYFCGICWAKIREAKGEF